MKRLVIIIFLLGYSTSFACSCKREKSIKESYNSNLIQSIIHGKILSKTAVSSASLLNETTLDSLKVKYNKSELESLLAKTILKIELEIIKEFKGKSKSKTLTIYTHSNSSACGFPWFKEGKEYLIYASSKSNSSYSLLSERDKKTLWTFHCLRTKEYDKLEAKQLTQLMN